MKVLIVDDSKLLRERIRLMLKSFSNVHVVGEACNGLEALHLIEKSSPDLAIIDIRMPEMNGIELLKQIRAKGFSQKICIFTNYPYKQYRDRCLAEGADYFFDKNRDIDQLTELIGTLSKERPVPKI